MRVPILMLTARHEVADRVSGLDAGADDYVVKPFALDELTARLRALLRRTSVTGEESIDPRWATSSSIRSAAPRRVVALPLDLTKTEFDLLELLMVNAGVVLPRDVIYERIWGFDFETSSRSLDVYVGLPAHEDRGRRRARMLHTVRGRRVRAAPGRPWGPDRSAGCRRPMSLRWRVALGLGLITVARDRVRRGRCLRRRGRPARGQRRRLARAAGGRGHLGGRRRGADRAVAGRRA